MGERRKQLRLGLEDQADQLAPDHDGLHQLHTLGQLGDLGLSQSGGDDVGIGGIGGRMLDAMLARCGKRACLEAELPETELAARRIGFYERHGFTVNAGYPYCQPALAPGGSPLPMHLLTTEGARTSAELRAMETLVHTRVYGQAPAAER